jgi:DNA-binding transcriptional LysR family regulator
MIDNDSESTVARSQLDLRALQTFIVVAQQRHFGKAAAVLGISQPAVSKQVHRLELQIGALLLTRSSRQVELTAAGQALLDEARGLLAHANGLAVRAQAIARGSMGRITIGFRDSANNAFLPELIRQFCTAHPDVDLALEELPSGSDQIAALRQNRIDIGFVRPPIDQPDLRAEAILDEPLVAVLPEQHRLARRRHVPIAALEHEPFVLWPRRAHPRLYDQTFGPGGKLGFAPQVHHEAIGTLAVLGLVAGGLGVSLLPASVLSLTRRGVILKPLAPPAPVLQLAIVRRLDDHSKTVANFINVARQVHELVPQTHHSASPPMA